MMRPLISIVVPVYKVEKYLSQCIESLINQTISNIEIILVDDGSPDQSPEICDTYAKQDKRIRVIHQINGGLSAARNAGIRVAQGEYIGFVDSDDFVDVTMFDTLLEMCKKNSTKIAACNFVYTYDDGNIDDVEESGCISILKCEDFFSRILDVHNRIEMVAWNKIYHHSIFDEVGMFPEGCIYEDLATMHKFIFSVDRVAYIDQTYYYYRRMREGAITNGKYSRAKEEMRLEFGNEMLNHISVVAPRLLSKASTFTCYNCNLTILNIMIQSLITDTEMIHRLKRDLKSKFRYWSLSDITVMKKAQLFIGMNSFSLYRWFHRLLKR